MKNKRLILTVVLIGMALIFSLTYPWTIALSNQPDKGVQMFVIPLGSGNAVFMGGGAPADPTRGEQIYKTKCIVCHQADGKGLPGAFPPLAGSDYLLADKVRAVAQVLNGSNLEITVNKLKFTTPMPPQVDNKEDAVAVINFVLNNFGNKGGQVTLEEVKDVVINPKK
jgi:mono/diheme cytochrome c family protein